MTESKLDSDNLTLFADDFKQMSRIFCSIFTVNSAIQAAIAESEIDYRFCAHKNRKQNLDWLSKINSILKLKAISMRLALTSAQMFYFLVLL